MKLLRMACRRAGVPPAVTAASRRRSRLSSRRKKISNTTAIPPGTTAIRNTVFIGTCSALSSSSAISGPTTAPV